MEVLLRAMAPAAKDGGTGSFTALRCRKDASIEGRVRTPARYAPIRRCTIQCATCSQHPRPYTSDSRLRTGGT